MKNFKISNDIPIKYHLNMHLMESLIDRDSIAFELIKYTIKNIAAHEKEYIIDNFKFTSRTLKYVFGDLLKDEKTKEYIINSIKEMIGMKWIKLKGKTMFITKEMLNNFYEIEE